MFLTRGKDGQLKRGLDAVPTGLSGRPVLLVGNHQLYGADLAPIVREFINTKGTLVRGLAHPMIFADRGVSTAQQKTFVKFGAVEVSPTNIFQVHATSVYLLYFIFHNSLFSSFFILLKRYEITLQADLMVSDSFTLTLSPPFIAA